MQEKRQFVRHPSSIPINVRLIGGQEQGGNIHDISNGGLAFVFHWPLAIGVRIEVHVPRLAEQIALIGRVVRCQRAKGQWMIGMGFEQVEQVFRMRMVQQICHIETYRERMRKEQGRELSSDEAAAEWIAAFAAHFPRCGL